MDLTKLSNIEKEAALNAMYASSNGLQKIAAVMLLHTATLWNV